MSDSGQLTLVFYRMHTDWTREPFMNILAAAAQGSKFPHVEMAIGSSVGNTGEMQNVLRIFSGENVELVCRTGRNPNFSYVQLGCSKLQEQKALSYARSVVGKPFSMVGMIRSVVYPRSTTGCSFFCAELVASTLQAAGLLSAHTNAGSATPQLLFELYGKNAAATANPFLLNAHKRAHTAISTSDHPNDLSPLANTKIGNLRIVKEERRRGMDDTLQLTFHSLDMRKCMLR